MVREETICTCDICGKEMYASITGSKHYQSYLVLGSNVKDELNIRFDDVCDECTAEIRKVIDTRKGVSPLNQYFSNKLAEL